MPKPPDNSSDAAEGPMPKTPPKLAAQKPKMNQRPPATKAEIAAQKRRDKTTIKRMRKL